LGVCRKHGVMAFDSWMLWVLLAAAISSSRTKIYFTELVGSSPCLVSSEFSAVVSVFEDPF